jgi:dipeptide/tripeptide permease
MISLLVLYMSEALFLPGHVEHIAGFVLFRAALEAVFGKMSTVALASQALGLYTGLVYFTPIFGGLIADRLIGRRRAVQNSNIGLIWDKAHLDLLGFIIPLPWFNAINSFVSILFVPVLLALWAWQARRGNAPGEIAKIATGAFITMAANLVLSLASLITAPVSPLYSVLHETLLGIGFLFYGPTLLALVSRQAPSSLKATLMGCVFLTLSISNMTIGRLGALYEHMTPAAFWSMEAAIAAAGGVLALLLKRPLERLLSAP